LDGVKTIDVFEMARVDPSTPIEVSTTALAELAKENKIGGIGLSEVGAATIRRAHAVHPIAAVEIELSLFTADALKNGVVQTCHERECSVRNQPGLKLTAVVSIPVVAYSPTCRGWLTGNFKKLDDLPPTDFRRKMPRFGPDVFDQNVRLVIAVEKLAKRKGVTTAQVAIAWVVKQGAIPIPGSTNLERICANSSVADLTGQDMLELQDILETLPIAGERYGGAHEKLLNA
jgi:pyridoxine 4-dehydrogenase